MATLNEIIARAEALRKESYVNSIDPERVGSIMSDTLKYLNEFQLQSGSMGLDKIYTSISAMNSDNAPVSDLTGKPLKGGQLAVIVAGSASEDNGKVYRFDNPGWTYVSTIGNLNIVQETGDSETAVMSQKAVTNLIEELKNAGYQFAGIATPETDPGTPDQNVFYIASTAGTYTNFDGLILEYGEIAILKYNGAWSKDSTGAVSLEIVNQLSQDVKNLPIIENNAIDNSKDVGLYINLPTSNSSWNAVNVKVNAGDKLLICGYGGQSFRLWATLDCNRRLVRKSEASVDATNNPVELVIGEGECYVVCNFNRSYVGYASLMKVAGTVDNLSKAVPDLSTSKEWKRDSALAADATLSLKEQYLRRNSVLSCVAVGSNPLITLGRGTKTTAYAYWAEIGSTNIVVKAYKSGSETTIATIAHGLTISSYLDVSIISKDTTAIIKIGCPNGTFESREFEWNGGGIPFVENNSSNTLDCTLSFYAEGQSNGILLIQDSYGIYWNNNTATYNLLKDNINGWQSNCQTGANGALMNVAFQNALCYGKPKYAVRSIGMNDNADSDANTPNSDWLARTTAFIAMCKDLGITPVLGTIPSVPSKLNDGKNKWIREESGVRYIDFAAAVGAQADGTWYEGMLGEDNVHPSVLGGKALEERLLSDFPEIILGSDISIDSKIINSQTLFNLNAFVEDKEYTSSEARNAVPKSARKLGLFITYKIASGIYKTEQYRGITPSGESWPDDTNWIVPTYLKGSTIVVASSTSFPVIKYGADMFSETANRDTAAINNAITLLSSIGGGIVHLCAGTYTGINSIRLASNVVLEGSGINSTILNATDAGAFDISIAAGVTNATVRNLKCRGINDLGTGTVIDDVQVDKISYINNEIHVYPHQGIDGIRAAIAILPNSGGTIYLHNGTYNAGTYSNIQFADIHQNKYGIRIVGEGTKTIIDSGGGNELIANNAIQKNCRIENVTFAHGVLRTRVNPCQMVRLINCYIGEEYVDESDSKYINVVNVGSGRFFETLSSAYDSFYGGVAPSRPISPTERWEIHVWGHIVETSQLTINKGYIDLVGHNAVIEMKGGKDVRVNFFDSIAPDYYGVLDVNVKDIHFLKTGCYAYWDACCVYVMSNYVTFENCIFENQSSSPVPYNQADYPSEGNEDYNGGRRHGIEIDLPKYGVDCKTTFKNCVAIGSPYGSNSCRGFYILFGAPKLFNCIGYGGGYAEFGHGILCHRAAAPELMNCIGYAGKNSYRKAAGIRFQAQGSGHLVGCIGYGSDGVQYKSEGVSTERIIEICTSLGLDTSTYVIDGEVQYSLLTDDICAQLTNDDVNLVALNSNIEESYGISFWANDGSARLINCQGYCGSGENSHGLHIIGQATPTIIDGMYGIEDKSAYVRVVANYGDGKYMQTTIDGLNAYTPYTISKVCVSITGGIFTTDTKLFIRYTKDGTNYFLVNSYNLKNISSIAMIPITPATIPAGADLVVFIKDADDNNIDIPSDRLILQFEYNFASDNSSALFIGGSSNPVVKGSVIKSDINSAAIETNGVSNIEVYDCGVRGTVGAGVTFASKTQINNSSNYTI